MGSSVFFMCSFVAVDNFLRTVDARANSLWRTLGELLSTDYNHHAKICYNAMLIA